MFEPSSFSKQIFFCHLKKTSNNILNGKICKSPTIVIYVCKIVCQILQIHIRVYIYFSFYVKNQYPLIFMNYEWTSH